MDHRGARPGELVQATTVIPSRCGGAVTLLDEYTTLCSTPSDIHMHLPRFVQFVRELDAQHVLELGTRTGVSTIAWLYGLEFTGGKLTSIDIDEQPAIGEHDAWTFIQGSDLDPAVVSQLEPAEIVFIDTSHTYEQTRAELALYRHLVKPGGVMLLHDTELMCPLDSPPSDPVYPVRVAMLEFCAAEGLEHELVRENNGLGIIRIG